MKNKLFFALSTVLALSLSLYLYSCQKEVAPKIESAARETDAGHEAVERGNLFGSVWFTVVSGNPNNLRSCGLGFTGVCGFDCSGNPLVGTKLITQTGTVNAFPKRFAVTNIGSTSATVNINYSCGPVFCGGTVSNVVVPANSQKVYVVRYNGSTCICEPDICE